MLKIRLNKILFSALVFIYIYMPPVFRFNTLFIIGGISIIHLLFARRLRYIKIRLNYTVPIIATLLVFIIGYIETGEIQNTGTGMLYLLLFSYPSCLMICDVAKRNRYDIETVLKTCIYIAVIQGGLSICAYLFPPVQSFFLVGIAKYASETLIKNWAIKRLYGYAVGITYAMPIFQGVIGVITLIYALKKNTKYLVFVPIIWLAGILNARTTFVVIIIGLAITIIYFTWKEPKKLIRFLFFYFILLQGGSWLISHSLNNASSAWIMMGLEDIISFLKGNQTLYFSDFTGSINSGVGIIDVPAGIGFWFGKGISVRSDIGYIHDMWAGGLIYCVLIYGTFINLVLDSAVKLRHELGNQVIIFGVFIILTCAIANLKGYAFANNEFMNLFLLFIVLSSFNSLPWNFDNNTN